MSEPFERPRYEFRSAVTLAKIVTAAFLVFGLIELYSVYLILCRLEVLPWLFAEEGLYQTVDHFEATLLAASLFVILAWCFWTYRVAANAHAFGGPIRMTPGWAVGAYFIPIFNLWRPYVALREAWVSSARSNWTAEDRWALPLPGAPAVMLAWWIFYRGGWVFERIGAATINEEDPANWENWMYLLVARLAIDLVAVALAVRVCWRLTRRQEECATAGMPRANMRKS